MTETAVLVLTDDELTCIAAANRSAWALPLGPERDDATVRTSALAGERSLVARRLVGPRDGKFALATEAFSYLKSGLHAGPVLALFVVDDQFRWVLEGMSIAWYRDGDADILETRAANGLHHFISTDRARLHEALRNYVAGAYDKGFPDARPGAGLSLCAVVPGAQRAFRVSQGSISGAPMTGDRLEALEWEASSLEEVLAELARA